MFSVDMRTRCEDPRPGNLLGRHHASQSLEFFVPLPRVAKCGHAVAEMTQRQLRIVLDVEVQIDESGDYRVSREVQPLSIGRQGHRVHRTDSGNPVTLDDHAGALYWPGA